MKRMYLTAIDGTGDEVGFDSFTISDGWIHFEYHNSENEIEHMGINLALYKDYVIIKEA